MKSRLTAAERVEREFMKLAGDVEISISKAAKVAKVGKKAAEEALDQLVYEGVAYREGDRYGKTQAQIDHERRGNPSQIRKLKAKLLR